MNCWFDYTARQYYLNIKYMEKRVHLMLQEHQRYFSTFGERLNAVRT
jgi:hypothetical protein